MQLIRWHNVQIEAFSIAGPMCEFTLVHTYTWVLLKMCVQAHLCCLNVLHEGKNCLRQAVDVLALLIHIFHLLRLLAQHLQQ